MRGDPRPRLAPRRPHVGELAELRHLPRLVLVRPGVPLRPGPRREVEVRAGPLVVPHPELQAEVAPEEEETAERPLVAQRPRHARERHAGDDERGAKEARPSGRTERLPGHEAQRHGEERRGDVEGPPDRAPEKERPGSRRARPLPPREKRHEHQADRDRRRGLDVPGPARDERAGDPREEPRARGEPEPRRQSREHPPHRALERDEDEPRDVPRREGRAEEAVDPREERRGERRHVRGRAGRETVGVGERPPLVERHRHGRHLEPGVRRHVPGVQLRQEEAVEADVEEEDESEGAPRRREPSAGSLSVVSRAFTRHPRSSAAILRRSSPRGGRGRFTSAGASAGRSSSRR